MRGVIFMVEDAVEGGLFASAVDYSIFTGANTLSELSANIRDAVLCHFTEGDRPASIRLHYCGDEFILV